MTETTNKGLPVHGYTPQASHNTDLVNSFKALEEALMRIVDAARGTDLDQRLVSIAATHFMEGFMSLNRSVFKPGRVDGVIVPSQAYADALKNLEVRSLKPADGSEEAGR